ncbi:helix-turn-helix domain-containing protein [Streptomyces sp. G5(2025)]|uniref:helix-turn-helix domain-containing protein n=1 Tax=Streptomyces sp. G5(2025) TaxID=3406628 RepID=UPI003C24AF44
MAADFMRGGPVAGEERGAEELAGRDEQLTAIDAALAGIAAVGTSVLLRGDPGMGKTALLKVAETRARDAGLRVLRMTGAEAEYELHLIRMSRRALTLTDDQVRDLSGRAPFADGPVASLLGTLLRQLVDTLPGGAPRTALRLAGATAERVDLLAVEEADPGPRGRDALMRRTRAYVDAHRWDRNLTPAAVAEARHISIRYLHKLFEGHGSTVGRWIQHRRLEEARGELARPGRGDITVSAVARRWGFASATYFSRGFRAAYGMSPSDWRDGRTKGTAEAGKADARPAT